MVPALVALVVGVTAMPALGWENERWKEDSQEQHGGKDRDRGKDHGDDYGKDRDNDYDSQKPPPVAPPAATPPQAQPPVAGPVPVAPQGAPAQTAPEQQAGGENAPAQPGGEEAEEESPVVAQQTPSAGQPAAGLAPVAERKELAQTGLDPGLIALIGVLCAGAGAFLFRRALVRE